MSALTSFRRGMIGYRHGYAAQARILAGDFNLERYLKHRVHQKNLARWIHLGMPDDSPPRRMNNKQRREATRNERMKTHNYRLRRFGLRRFE